MGRKTAWTSVKQDMSWILVFKKEKLRCWQITLHDTVTVTFKLFCQRNLWTLSFLRLCLSLKYEQLGVKQSSCWSNYFWLQQKQLCSFAFPSFLMVWSWDVPWIWDFPWVWYIKSKENIFSLDLRFSLGFSFGWDEKSVDARGPGTHKSSMGWESFVIVIDLGFVVSESIKTAESEKRENMNM